MWSAFLEGRSAPSLGKTVHLELWGWGAGGSLKKPGKSGGASLGDRSGTVPMSSRGLEASAVSIQLQASCGERLGRPLLGGRQQEDS